jgi:hypothetical protein
VLDFTGEDISDPVLKNIFLKMAELYSSDEIISVDRMFDIFIEGSERRFLEEAISKEYEISNKNEAYSDYYLNIKLHHIDQKFAWHAEMINTTDNESLRREHMTEIEILRREREKLTKHRSEKISR